MVKPTCVDLFCGLGGWAEGFLAEGYEVIGYDIEAHDYGTGGYPGDLHLRDVLTIDGVEFNDAACIVASPPCQEYSYMAMPWSRAKHIAAALRGKGEFPEGYTGSRTIADLNRLFEACFRIQREASEAAGRRIPMVVENVRGAQAWVGEAPANYGSFYLWGDVGMVGRRVVCVVDGKVIGGRGVAPAVKGQKFNPDGTAHPRGSWFAVADSVNRGAREAQKVPGFRFDGSGKTSQTASVQETGQKNPGGGWDRSRPSHTTDHSWDSGVKAGDRSVDGKWSSSFADTLSARDDGQKVGEYSDPRRNGGRGCHLTSPQENVAGVKQGGNWFHDSTPGTLRSFSGTKQAGISGVRENSKGDNSRKAASAMIAKIPFPLAQCVAQSFKPDDHQMTIAECYGEITV